MLSEHHSEMLGRIVHLSGAQLEFSVSKVHVKTYLPLHGESQVPGAPALRVQQEGEGGRYPAPPHLLPAASPRDLVSEDTRTFRAIFCLLEAEIPESLYGREITLRQAQRKQY